MYYIQQSKNIYLKGLQKLCSFFFHSFPKFIIIIIFVLAFVLPDTPQQQQQQNIRKEIICFQCSFPAAAAVTPIK